MYIGVLELTFRLDGCRSLKDKRRVVKSLVDRLRHHFSVSAAEVAEQNEHERAVVGVAVVSGDRQVVERLLAHMIDYAEASCDAELIGIEQEII